MAFLVEHHLPLQDYMYKIHQHLIYSPVCGIPMKFSSLLRKETDLEPRKKKTFVIKFSRVSEQGFFF